MRLSIAKPVRVSGWVVWGLSLTLLWGSDKPENEVLWIWPIQLSCRQRANFLEVGELMNRLLSDQDAGRQAVDAMDPFGEVSVLGNIKLVAVFDLCSLLQTSQLGHSSQFKVPALTGEWRWGRNPH